MSTRLSDVKFDNDIYLSYYKQQNPARNAFVASGVVVNNPLLNQRAAGQGLLTTVPYWNYLSTDNENVSSDDPSVKATPEKITAGEMTAVVADLNNAWQSADLVQQVLGNESPMRAIAEATNTYWVNRLSIRVQAIQQGLLLSNIANNSSDMVHDISIQDGNAATDANKFSFKDFVSAYSTMGENADNLKILVVHPVVMERMRQNEKIDQIQDSQTGILYSVYNGLRLIEDKRQPVIAGATSGFRYVSTIYAAGAFGLGEAMPPNPVAVERDELAGNGGGVETLVERKRWLLHPAGFTWTGSGTATPTVAQCALAANWARTFDRENVPMAWLITNG